VPDGPTYETVGGFVMAVLGRIPEVGDEVEVTGWGVRVARMDGRRVDRLRFTPVTAETTPDDAESGDPKATGAGSVGSSDTDDASDASVATVEATS